MFVIGVSTIADVVESIIWGFGFVSCWIGVEATGSIGGGSAEGASERSTGVSSAIVLSRIVDVCVCMLLVFDRDVLYCFTRLCFTCLSFAD